MPKRTAYRWSKEPEVKSAVGSYRGRIVDRAVGRFATRSTWAVNEITTLAKRAESESVQLGALRAILSNLIAVSRFAALEQSITEIKEQLRARAPAANPPGQPPPSSSPDY